MPARDFFASQDADDELGELTRALEGPHRPTCENAPSNVSRHALLAELENHLGELGFLRGVDKIRRGRPLLRHAHVEGPIALEGKAALGVIDLLGGDTDVEHDAVDGGEASLLSDTIELAECALAQAQTAG